MSREMTLQEAFDKCSGGGFLTPAEVLSFLKRIQELEDDRERVKNNVNDSIKLLGKRIRELEGKLCKGREALERSADHLADTSLWKRVREALSSPSPCRHEVQLKALQKAYDYSTMKDVNEENSRLREAVEKIDNITSDIISGRAWITKASDEDSPVTKK